MTKFRFVRPLHCALVAAFWAAETGSIAAAEEAPAQVAPPAAAGQGETSPAAGRRGGRRGQGGGAGPTAEQAAAPGGTATAAGAGVGQQAGGSGQAGAAGRGAGGAGAGQAGGTGGGQRGGGAAGAGGRGGGRGGRGGNTVQPVEVVKLTRADLIDSISIVGSIAANETSAIRPEVAGIVREIFFNEGQVVRKGEVLLRLDDNELRAQYNQAKAAFELARVNFSRTETLMKTANASAAEFDRSQADYSSAEANLQLVAVRLARTEIRAPFDGVVNSRAVSPGDLVNTQTTITTIDDLSRMKVDFLVPERYQGSVKVGNPFTLKVNVGSTALEGKGEVYFVSSSIDRNVRSVQVKGLMAPGSTQFRPGMFANIELVLEVKRGVLTVPEGAILATPAGAQVVAVVVRDGQSISQSVNVKLGLRAHGLVEITPIREGDLAEGQSVVGSGVGGLQLFNGGRVDPRPLNPAFKGGN
jgi:membrane fusion protein (multidrug efflux system)